MSGGAAELAKRRLLKLAGAALALGALPAAAQQPHARENFEYFAIKPQAVPAGSRIEVIEFFWYGCPFCYRLQPYLDGWLKRKPADVDFRRVPAVFRPSWAQHARIFFALQTLGELERLHQTVYRSIHVDRDSLLDADSTSAWAARNGIEAARWLAAYNAPEVERAVEQSPAVTRGYEIKGTPSLVVDGRHVTSTSMAESFSGVIGILDDLIRVARERRAEK